MAVPFLKLMKNSAALQIMKHHKAFTLLCFIGQRTNRTPEDCIFNGLEIGEAPIGDYEAMGFTRSEYRAAIKRLTNDQQATIKTTNRGTIAKLTNKAIINVNLESNDQQKTTERPDYDQTTTTTKEVRSKNKELIKEINKEKFSSENLKEPLKGIVQFYEEKFKTKLLSFSDTRKKHLSSRIQTFGAEKIRDAIQNFSVTPFWLGKNDRNWKVDLDYMIRSDENIEKGLKIVTSREKTKSTLWVPPVNEEPPINPERFAEMKKEIAQKMTMPN